MSKADFLKSLEQLLQDISDEEREEALEFYRNYFEEAGESQEDQVIQELGSPERVAAQIKDGLRGRTENGEYTDTGYEDPRYRDETRVPRYYDAGREHRGGIWKVFGIICICIFAVPLGLPILGILFGLATAILAVIFSFGVVLVTFTAVGFIVGVIFFCVGVSKLAAAPALGLLFCGSGFLSAALGLICMVLTLWVLRHGLPGTCRGVAKLWRNIFHRRGEKRE